MTAKLSSQEKEKYLVLLLNIRNRQLQKGGVHEKFSSEEIFMYIEEMFVQCNFHF